MTRQALIRDLQSYTGEDVEMRQIESYLRLLEERERCFFRDCFDPGHITGSCLVLHKNRDRILLNHHAIFDMWMNFGGHADGEEDIFAVATRELEEEAGIRSFQKVIPGIFDVDAHPIAPNAGKNEPGHLHFDIEYLFEVETDDFVISEESRDIRWFTLDEADALFRDKPNPGMERCLAKIRRLTRTP